jgi:REP element-mobilizing transposase RayT
MPYYERHLPHWQPDEAWLFITWRLAGSLPASAPSASTGEAFVAFDRTLDQAATGPTWLKDPRVARMVCDVIQQSESPRRLCKLGGYVVMSNHVHLLARPLDKASTLTHWVKGTSAYYANQILNRTSRPFWLHESFDHWVRNEREYGRILSYIGQNPVRAGLVESPEQWPWSSTGQAKACPT